MNKDYDPNLSFRWLETEEVERPDEADKLFEVDISEIKGKHHADPSGKGSKKSHKKRQARKKKFNIEYDPNTNSNGEDNGESDNEKCAHNIDSSAKHKDKKESKSKEKCSSTSKANYNPNASVINEPVRAPEERKKANKDYDPNETLIQDSLNIKIAQKPNAYDPNDTNANFAPKSKDPKYMYDPNETTSGLNQDDIEEEKPKKLKKQKKSKTKTPLKSEETNPKYDPNEEFCDLSSIYVNNKNGYDPNETSSKVPDKKNNSKKLYDPNETGIPSDFIPNRDYDPNMSVIDPKYIKKKSNIEYDPNETVAQDISVEAKSSDYDPNATFFDYDHYKNLPKNDLSDLSIEPINMRKKKSKAASKYDPNCTDTNLNEYVESTFNHNNLPKIKSDKYFL